MNIRDPLPSIHEGAGTPKLREGNGARWGHKAARSLLDHAVTFCLWSLVIGIVFPLKGHHPQGSNHYCFAACGEGQNARHQMTKKKHGKKRNKC